MLSEIAKQTFLFSWNHSSIEWAKFQAPRRSPFSRCLSKQNSRWHFFNLTQWLIYFLCLHSSFPKNFCLHGHPRLTRAYQVWCPYITIHWGWCHTTAFLNSFTVSSQSQRCTTAAILLISYSKNKWCCTQMFWTFQRFSSFLWLLMMKNCSDSL